MNWLLPPSDFRAELRAAAGEAEPALRLERLAALAGCRLDPLQTLQLDRELGRLPPPDAGDRRTVRLALLSDATVQHLLPALRVAALRHGLRLEGYAGAYGQTQQEVFDAASALYRFAPDAVLLAPTAQRLLGGVPLAAGAQQADTACEQAVDGITALWRALRVQSAAAVLLQQNVLDTAPPVFGSLDRQVPGAPARLVERLNARLAQAAAGAGVGLLDLAGAAARDGRAAWFDRGHWLQAKMEIAPPAAPRYAEHVARLLAAYRGRSRKCLVLDLDNTLWGGVIGDDGLAGIRLGEGSGVGEAHLALQRYAKALSERGIVLAVCSKNDAAIAEAAFRDHPEMVLRRDDIAAFVVNWRDKAENLQAIAAQLNIGLDSLVFVDDHPAERARVRASLPAVAVPELPSDAAGYVDCLADAGYFEAVAFTNEDRARSRLYQEEVQRAALRGSAQSLDDFLRGLDMVVEAGPVGPLQLERATQLVNKTNQFNTTGRRLSADELARHAAGPDTLALQFRLLDRLGDNGLVSVMLLRQRDDAVLEIDNWVMSCRVFGREFEFEILNIAAELARERGASALEAAFVATERNGVIADLFPRLGFAPLPPSAAAAAQRWRLALATFVPRPTPIRRKPPA